MVLFTIQLIYFPLIEFDLWSQYLIKVEFSSRGIASVEVCWPRPFTLCVEVDAVRGGSSSGEVHLTEVSCSESVLARLPRVCTPSKDLEVGEVQTIAHFGHVLCLIPAHPVVGEDVRAVLGHSFLG